jgi:LacI family transcriptional regulator
MPFGKRRGVRSRARQNRVTPHIALVIETSLASGRDILCGIGRYVREHGPWSIYHEPRSLEESVPRWLSNWDGDGIIARVQNTRIAGAVVSTGIPAVDVLGVVRSPELPLAHVDNDAVARLAADHFLERGFRHFGYCGLEGINWSDERRDAFCRAVTEAGSQCVVYTLRAGRGSWEDEQDQLAAWVRSLPRPCAVMACNDPRGQKILEACRRIGVRVPDEVAVVGVDNDVPICSISDPPLSSVVPDHERVGYEAAKLLDRFRAGEEEPGAAVYVPPAGLVTRQSSDVLALTDRDIAEAISLIREHACMGLGVDEVCRELALSRSTLQRRFRRLLGHTIHEEIVRVRLKRAQELLAETDMPIATIAQRCGFGRQEYLGMVFRARLGQTPASYRRRGSVRSGERG